MSPIEKDPPGRFREIIRYGEISDMYDVLNALARSLREGNPDMGTVEWYRAIDAYIPGKVPEDTSRMLLDVAGTSCDGQEAAQAKFVYLLLHMKTVLSASERFLGRTEIDEEEVIDVAALRARESMPNIAGNNDHRISILLNGQISRAVKQFVAKCTGSPYQIVNHEDFFTILKAVRGKLAGRPSGLSKQQICKWAETLSDSYGLGAKTLRRFLRAQQEMYFATETTMDEDDVVEEVFHAIRVLILFSRPKFGVHAKPPPLLFYSAKCRAMCNRPP